MMINLFRDRLGSHGDHGIHHRVNHSSPAFWEKIFFPGILLWDCTTPAFMYGTASDIFYTVGACTKVKTHIVIEPIEVVQFDTSY